jgi:hypothetical protein
MPKSYWGWGWGVKKKFTSSYFQKIQKIEKIPRTELLSNSYFGDGGNSPLTTSIQIHIIDKIATGLDPYFLMSRNTLIINKLKMTQLEFVVEYKNEQSKPAKL